jgi:hypothetical protein
LIDLGVDLGVDPKTICESAPISNDGFETVETVTQVKKKPAGKRSQVFERGFKLLQECKETYDTTILPSQENRCQGKLKAIIPFLRKWRAVRAKKGETQQSSATKSRIRRLVSLGFLDEEEYHYPTIAGEPLPGKAESYHTVFEEMACSTSQKGRNPTIQRH